MQEAGVMRLWKRQRAIMPGCTIYEDIYCMSPFPMESHRPLFALETLPEWLLSGRKSCRYLARLTFNYLIFCRVSNVFCLSFLFVVFLSFIFSWQLRKELFFFFVLLSLSILLLLLSLSSSPSLNPHHNFLLLTSFSYSSAPSPLLLLLLLISPPTPPLIVPFFIFFFTSFPFLLPF